MPGDDITAEVLGPLFEVGLTFGGEEIQYEGYSPKHVENWSQEHEWDCSDWSANGPMFVDGGYVDDMTRREFDEVVRVDLDQCYNIDDINTFNIEVSLK